MQRGLFFNIFFKKHLFAFCLYFNFTMNTAFYYDPRLRLQFNFLDCFEKKTKF